MNNNNFDLFVFIYKLLIVYAQALMLFFCFGAVLLRCSFWREKKNQMNQKDEENIIF